MNAQINIYLASGSPRRLELLKNLGCRIAQIKVPFLEPKVSNFKAPLAFMDLCLAEKFRQTNEYIQNKKEIHNVFQNGAKMVMVADTIVVLGPELLGKPVDKIEAFEMLQKLSGREHKVFTGYKLWITCAQLCEPAFFRTKTVITKVRFKTMPQKFLKDYIHSGEPMDKAGAYGVQGVGLQMIESIDGDYASVMGLPLCELLPDLRAAIEFLNKGTTT